MSSSIRCVASPYDSSPLPPLPAPPFKPSTMADLWGASRDELRRTLLDRRRQASSEQDDRDATQVAVPDAMKPVSATLAHASPGTANTSVPITSTNALAHHVLDVGLARWAPGSPFVQPPLRAASVAAEKAPADWALFQSHARGAHAVVATDCFLQRHALEEAEAAGRDFVERRWSESQRPVLVQFAAFSNVLLEFTSTPASEVRTRARLELNLFRFIQKQIVTLGVS